MPISFVFYADTTLIMLHLHNNGDECRCRRIMLFPLSTVQCDTNMLFTAKKITFLEFPFRAWRNTEDRDRPFTVKLMFFTATHSMATYRTLKCTRSAGKLDYGTYCIVVISILVSPSQAQIEKKRNGITN